jgi:hypothetical protein
MWRDKANSVENITESNRQAGTSDHGVLRQAPPRCINHARCVGLLDAKFVQWQSDG